MKEQIEKLVKIIYTPDKTDFEQEFVVLLDGIDRALQEGKEIAQYLNPLQEAYVKKDYIALADVLLCDILPCLD